jgi:hypothetical protein
MYFIHVNNQTRRRGDIMSKGAKLTAYREHVKGSNGALGSRISYVIEERDANHPIFSPLSEVAVVLQQNGQSKKP